MSDLTASTPRVSTREQTKDRTGLLMACRRPSPTSHAARASLVSNSRARTWDLPVTSAHTNGPEGGAAFRRIRTRAAASTTQLSSEPNLPWRRSTRAATPPHPASGASRGDESSTTEEPQEPPGVSVSESVPIDVDAVEVADGERRSALRGASSCAAPQRSCRTTNACTAARTPQGPPSVWRRPQAQAGVSGPAASSAPTKSNAVSVQRCTSCGSGLPPKSSSQSSRALSSGRAVARGAWHNFEPSSCVQDAGGCGAAADAASDWGSSASSERAMDIARPLSLAGASSATGTNSACVGGGVPEHSTAYELTRAELCRPPIANGGDLRHRSTADGGPGLA
mmetsp:Transcript_30239/g.89802  ORF Transcript_30239/g.89802 Transcript_30239/m.89802 type:complete len:339 (+) Transcript_30239:840-1856(+)